MTNSVTINAPVDVPRSNFSPALMLALAASLVIHAAVLVGRQLDLSPAPQLEPLQVSMVRTAPDLTVGAKPPPPQAAKKDRAAKPKQVPPPGASMAKLPDPPVQDSKEDAGLKEAPQDLTESAPSDTPPEVIDFSGTAWPPAGRIGYEMLMGEHRLPAGKTTHQWEVTDDGKYRMEALTEPTGLPMIPWFKPGRTMWISVGNVTPQGLQPETFIERREGSHHESRADMDRAANLLIVAGVSTPLPENMQDALSIFYQLGYPGVPTLGEMTVIDGKKVDGIHLEVVGEEQLEMPFGQTLRTQHIKARVGTGKEQIEVWVAVERFGLPVQIRKIDAKGVVYFWIANEIKVAGKRVGQ